MRLWPSSPPPDSKHPARTHSTAPTRAPLTPSDDGRQGPIRRPSRRESTSPSRHESKCAACGGHTRAANDAPLPVRGAWPPFSRRAPHAQRPARRDVTGRPLRTASAADARSAPLSASARLQETARKSKPPRPRSAAEQTQCRPLSIKRPRRMPEGRNCGVRQSSGAHWLASL